MASHIPLPESSTGSNYLESTTRDTSAEYESRGAQLAVPNEHNQGLQNTEQGMVESTSIPGAEEPRKTAAETAYPGELAGVGGAYVTFSMPKANLDDELTTDTHDDRVVRDDVRLRDISSEG